MSEQRDDNDLPADDPEELGKAHAEELRRIVLRKSVRRERARRRGDDSILAWLGTFGMVGWTVVVPTLAGLAFGIFLDARLDASVSFTITFLLLGAAAGVSMAWYWVRQESQEDNRR